MANSSEKFIKQNEENLDIQDTLHEQLKKIKEEHEKVLEDSRESSENQEDMDNPVHEYCS